MYPQPGGLQSIKSSICTQHSPRLAAGVQFYPSSPLLSLLSPWAVLSGALPTELGISHLWKKHEDKTELPTTASWPQGDRPPQQQREGSSFQISQLGTHTTSSQSRLKSMRPRPPVDSQFFFSFYLNNFKSSPEATKTIQRIEVLPWTLQDFCANKETPRAGHQVLGGFTRIL